MLTHLFIGNYALIGELEIGFPAGFSVITGETGAGKSIILGALGLLMGQRADAKAIKTGEKKCVVEGTFDVSALELGCFFEENDIDFDGKECLIRREVYLTGKSRAFVNDTPVPLSLLKELCPAVIDIHSQHQNLLMGREHFLMDVLDTIAHNREKQEAYRHSYQCWRTLCKELEDLKRRQQESNDNLDYVQFQYAQLEEAGLCDGEQEELEQEAEMLSHAEEIKSGLYESRNFFAEEGGDVVGKLKQTAHVLQRIAAVYHQANGWAERVESTRIELEDISDELERAIGQVEFDPARQQFVDERLGVIYALEKKHRVETIGELLEIKERLDQELNSFENSEELVRQKEAEVSRQYDVLSRLGSELTASRKAAAEATAEQLKETLQFLGMPNVRMHFEVGSRPVPDASGFDTVTFLFSANKNVPEQDVTQIASGGEIARLMLALKAFISRSSSLPTIIFDEIDTGVSGTVAEKMAQVMQQMAANCQVICITHLPQIAALGQQHYWVHKTDTDTGTSSHITCLSQEERVREIANMLSGAEMTEAAINNAKSLLGMV